MVNIDILRGAELIVQIILIIMPNLENIMLKLWFLNTNHRNCKTWFKSNWRRIELNTTITLFISFASSISQWSTHLPVPFQVWPKMLNLLKIQQNNAIDCWEPQCNTQSAAQSYKINTPPPLLINISYNSTPWLIEHKILSANFQPPNTHSSPQHHSLYPLQPYHNNSNNHIQHHKPQIIILNNNSYNLTPPLRSYKNLRELSKTTTHRIKNRNILIFFNLAFSFASTNFYVIHSQLIYPQCVVLIFLMFILLWIHQWLIVYHILIVNLNSNTLGSFIGPHIGDQIQLSQIPSTRR